MKVIMLRAVTGLVAAVSTVACGLDASGTGDVATAPGSSGGMSSGASSGGGSSGASSGGGSSGSGGSSGAMSGTTDSGALPSDTPATDPEVAYAATLKMSSFSVAAGQEVFMCQDFANPFHAQQADIKTYELHMAQGSHHMLAFYKVGALDGPLIPCPEGGLEFGPFTFAAQSPNVIQTYPEGIGATVPGDTGFTINSHYANAGSTTINAQLALTMYVAKPGVVTQHAGVIFLNQLSLFIPPSDMPGSPYTSSMTYVLGQDVNILSTGSHMHQRATNFVATTSTGQTLFQTTQWDEPGQATFSPPLQLPSGTSITWSCTYVNDTGLPLVFGPSAQTNAMCISTSIFYPVNDVRHPVLSYFH